MGSEGSVGDCGGWTCEGALVGGVLDENLAEILENHELRRPGEVPDGVGLSIEPDRPGLFGTPEPFCVVDWPLVEVGVVDRALSGVAEAGDLDRGVAPGICRGRAGEDVLEGGEFFCVLSNEEVSLVSLFQQLWRSDEARISAAVGVCQVATDDMPLCAPWVIQLTSMP